MAIKSIGKMKITVNAMRKESKYKTFAIAELFGIDETNLNEEYAKQASLYAYFAQLMAETEYTRAVISLGKEHEYAAADLEYREELAKMGKKYTEPMIKNMVLSDEEYQRLSSSKVEAEYDYKLLRIIVTALDMRANMLVSLGAHLRAEMDMTGMNIRERKYNGMVNDVKDAVKKSRG